MNKSTKGAVAIAAAATLLVGGAGTLAFWNAKADLGGDKVNAGELKLGSLNLGDQPTWKLNGQTVDGTVVIVPGDQLVFSGQYEIQAAGNNLQATVALVSDDNSGDTGFVTTDVDYTIDGQRLTTVTEENDGDVIDVHATVDFPFNAQLPADNSSQGKSLNLGDMHLTLTQTDATPPV